MGVCVNENAYGLKLSHMSFQGLANVDGLWADLTVLVWGGICSIKSTWTYFGPECKFVACLVFISQKSFDRSNVILWIYKKRPGNRGGCVWKESFWIKLEGLKCVGYVVLQKVCESSWCRVKARHSISMLNYKNNRTKIHSKFSEFGPKQIVW